MGLRCVGRGGAGDRGRGAFNGACRSEEIKGFILGHFTRFLRQLTKQCPVPASPRLIGSETERVAVFQTQ